MFKKLKKDNTQKNSYIYKKKGKYRGRNILKLLTSQYIIYNHETNCKIKIEILTKHKIRLIMRE